MTQLSNSQQPEGALPVYSFTHGDQFVVTNETTGEIVISTSNSTEGFIKLLDLYEDTRTRVVECAHVMGAINEWLLQNPEAVPFQPPWYARMRELMVGMGVVGN